MTKDDLLEQMEKAADVLEAHALLWLPAFVEDRKYRAGYADATKAAVEKIRSILREELEKEESSIA